MGFDDGGTPGRIEGEAETYGHAQDGLLRLLHVTLGHCGSLCKSTVYQKRGEERMKGHKRWNDQGWEEEEEKEQDDEKKGRKKI